MAGVSRFTKQANLHSQEGDRIQDLQDRIAILNTDCSDWLDRCQSIETNIDRARKQCDEAEARLALTGESVPVSGAGNLTLLQESYRNFAMLLKMQEQKREHASNRVAMLQEQRAEICAEVRSLSADPPEDEGEYLRAA